MAIQIPRAVKIGVRDSSDAVVKEIEQEFKKWKGSSSGTSYEK